MPTAMAILVVQRIRISVPFAQLVSLTVLLPGPQTAVRGPGHRALVPRSYLLVQPMSAVARDRARPRPFGTARGRALRLALGLPPGSLREKYVSQEPDERREGAPIRHTI